MTFDPIEERDATIAELRAEVRAWEDWSNRLAENIPDHYDGDDAQEAIIEKYVADLRAEVERLTQVVARRKAHAEQAEAEVERLNEEIERLRGWIDRAERMQRERDAAESARAEWERLYREAVGVPASEHQQRRMEQVAQKWEAAESALRQVREERDEAVATLARIKAMAWSPALQSCGGTDPEDDGCFVADLLRPLRRVLDEARVGVADTQPEGAGEALGRIRALLAMREDNDVRDEDGFAVVRVDDVRAMFPPHSCEGDGTCIHCGADEPPEFPTAGGKVDTAPEALSHGETWQVGKGTPHSHRTYVEGCFRCDLSRADTAPESGEGR